MRKTVVDANSVEELGIYKFSQPKLVFFKIFKFISDIDKNSFPGFDKPDDTIFNGGVHRAEENRKPRFSR